MTKSEESRPGQEISLLNTYYYTVGKMHIKDLSAFI
jgi:hypothetical protein